MCGASRTVIARVLLALTLALPAAGSAADPWKRIEEGQTACARDDHAAAIDAFRRAIEEDPSVRDTIGVALASQLTWAGRYDEAIAEFRHFLAGHPGRTDALMNLALAQSWSDRVADALETYRRVLKVDPDHRDASFGEARMLAWLGRLDASLRAYDRLLAREPGFVDAALGRAQVVNWRGDHRRAAGLYSEVLANDPGRTAALEGRAAAWNWAGCADRALSDLAAADRGKGSADATDLERAIRRSWRPAAGMTVDLSRDSDDFQLVTVRLEGELPLVYRAHIRTYALRNRFTKPDRPATDDLWIGTRGDGRLSDDWLVYGSAQILADRPAGVDRFRGTGDAHVAWLPHDRVRIDAGYGRAVFFTYERSPDGTARYIDADLVDLGASIRPFWRTTASVSADRGWYRDGNRRVNLRARLRHTLLSKPRLWIEAGGQWLDHEKDLAGGLWTPVGFRSLLFAPEIEWTLTDGLVLSSRIDTGFARDRHTDASSYLTAAGGVRFDRGRVAFELRGGRADSNIETGRGYKRSFGTLLARVRL